MLLGSRQLLSLGLRLCLRLSLLLSVQMRLLLNRRHSRRRSLLLLLGPCDAGVLILIPRVLLLKRCLLLLVLSLLLVLVYRGCDLRGAHCGLCRRATKDPA